MSWRTSAGRLSRRDRGGGRSGMTWTTVCTSSAVPSTRPVISIEDKLSVVACMIILNTAPRPGSLLVVEGGFVVDRRGSFDRNGQICAA